MRFSIVSAIIASAGLVAAAPASRPTKPIPEGNYGGTGFLGNALAKSGSGTANGMGAFLQDVIAEAFKAGDAFLNFPSDAITRLFSGNPGSALTNGGSDAMTLLGQLPGDFKKLGTDIGSGVSKDISKTAPKTS